MKTDFQGFCFFFFFLCTDSFGELEADNGNEDVVELPEDIIPKTVATKRTRSNKGRSAKKSKSNKIPDDVFDCSDVCIPDNEVSVNPGLGQKTAVKKLTKLKRKSMSEMQVVIQFTCSYANLIFRIVFHFRMT